MEKADGGYAGIMDCPGVTCRRCGRLFTLLRRWPQPPRRLWTRKYVVCDEGPGPLDDLDQVHYCTMYKPVVRMGEGTPKK